MAADQIVAGQKAEPNPDMAKGRVASIPVKVQAAVDDGKLYMRFQWKAGSGAKKMDEKNPAKLAVMLDAGKVQYGEIGGCWASCHDDLRSMPDVNPAAKDHPRAKELDIRSDGPTKYLAESRTAISTPGSPATSATWAAVSQDTITLSLIHISEPTRPY